MALLIAIRVEPKEFMIMQQTLTPEEIIFFLLIAITGVMAILLTVAYMVYGQDEDKV